MNFDVWVDLCSHHHNQDTQRPKPCSAAPRQSHPSPNLRLETSDLLSIALASSFQECRVKRITRSAYPSKTEDSQCGQLSTTLKALTSILPSLLHQPHEVLNGSDHHQSREHREVRPGAQSHGSHGTGPDLRA